MLFLAIERFKNHDPAPIRERFLANGRMLPDTVTYHASWIDRENTRCFELMEAADAAMLDPWIESWRDLVDFEIVPVEPSQEYWATFENRATGS